LLSSLSVDGQEIRVHAFDNVATLTQALNSGAIDLALMEGNEGDGGGLMLVAELYPSVLHILYRADNVPATVRELLQGHKVWAGAPGGIGHRLARALAADFGLEGDEFQLLDDPWSQEPDVYFIFGGILAADALSRLGQFRLFSLGDPATLMRGSVAEGVSLRYPQLQPFILPAQLYPTLADQAALTLSVSTLLVANQAVDEDMVYDLAMKVSHLAPRIAALYPLAGLSRPGPADDGPRMLPLHPGARRYRDRDLPGFIERYAEVLGMSATLFIACGSLLLAWRRHRQQLRKDRLDTYYQQLLSLRGEMEVAGVDTRASARQVRATQAEVMALVIEERIDADGALLAFLALSNQLLAEADRLHSSEPQVY
jgi:TRAP-type uncharacterized transport system substrate-binding protein